MWEKPLTQILMLYDEIELMNVVTCMQNTTLGHQASSVVKSLSCLEEVRGSTVPLQCVMCKHITHHKCN